MEMKKSLVSALMAGSAGLYPAMRTRSTTRRTRKAVTVKRRGKAARPKRAGKRRVMRLVKGSKAAKAYMAKIRRKRRR